MIFEDLLWFAMFISPFIGVVTFLILGRYQKNMKKHFSILISIFILLLVFLTSIYIVIFVIGNQLTEVVTILFSWYWFLLILSPLFIIGIYLMKNVKRESLILFLSTTVAISLALIISSFLILFAKFYTNPDLMRNPGNILKTLLGAIEVLLNASFGFDKIPLLFDGISTNDADFYRECGRTLGLATPLIFTGLVFAVSAKAGLFNIGAEGAFTLGGFTGAVIGVWLPSMIPFPFSPLILVFIHIPLAFLCSALVGAIFGMIPGMLRAYLGAHEVITTIMMNPIAYLLVFMLVRDYYTVPDLRTETPPVMKTCELPRLLPGPLGAEYLIAIFIAVAIYFFLFHTTYGLEMRAIGDNPAAAEYAGIPVKKRQIQVMTLAGAIGAIGGAGMSLGFYYYFHPSHPLGIGFDGIAVSVIGANSPIIIIIVAILFGVIKNGGESLSTTMGIPKDIIATMRGLIILFAAAPMVFSFLFKRRSKKGDGNFGNKDNFIISDTKQKGSSYEIKESTSKEGLT
ncbi:MAG: ABC transporter permease [Candidatus Thorarchaeota archaeon]